MTAYCAVIACIERWWSCEGLDRTEYREPRPGDRPHLPDDQGGDRGETSSARAATFTVCR
jgi:hypothetical protein